MNVEIATQLTTAVSAVGMYLTAGVSVSIKNIAIVKGVTLGQLQTAMDVREAANVRNSEYQREHGGTAKIYVICEERLLKSIKDFCDAYDLNPGGKPHGL